MIQRNLLKGHKMFQAEIGGILSLLEVLDACWFGTVVSAFNNGMIGTAS